LLAKVKVGSAGQSCHSIVLQQGLLYFANLTAE